MYSSVTLQILLHIQKEILTIVCTPPQIKSILHTDGIHITYCILCNVAVKLLVSCVTEAPD